MLKSQKEAKGLGLPSIFEEAQANAVVALINNNYRIQMNVIQTFVPNFRKQTSRNVLHLNEWMHL
jgi:hypothetical protein